jgi:hypothetical protein
MLTDQQRSEKRIVRRMQEWLGERRVARQQRLLEQVATRGAAQLAREHAEVPARYRSSQVLAWGAGS